MRQAEVSREQLEEQKEMAEKAILADLVRSNTRKTMAMSAFSLALIIGLAYGLHVLYRDSENSTANIGRGSQLDKIPIILKKAKQCTHTSDCPDETECNEDGLCVPVLHYLPETGKVFKHVGKQIPRHMAYKSQ